MENIFDQLTSKKDREVGKGETFTVSRGEHVFLGSDPDSVRRRQKGERSVRLHGVPQGMLSRCVLELFLNEEGKLRARKGWGEKDGRLYVPRNEVEVWGQTEKADWIKERLVGELPDKIWQQFDQGEVFVDIRVGSPQKGELVLRLGTVSREQAGETFQVGLRTELYNVKDANLAKGKPEL